MIAYISIGNSDDKLPQAEWAELCANISQLLNPDDTGLTLGVLGKWFSLPNEPWQNACWCVGIPSDEAAAAIKHALGRLAGKFGQESIAFAEADTEFLRPRVPGPILQDLPEGRVS